MKVKIKVQYDKIIGIKIVTIKHSSVSFSNKTNKFSPENKMSYEGVQHSCGQCGKQFTTKMSVTKHRREVHEGVKHSCGQCGKHFTQAGNLAEHRRAVHEGVKHPCGQCGKHFTQAGNLARHKREVHEGVKHP